MKIVDRGTVFRDQPGGERQSATFSGLAVLPTGRWLCTFRAAPIKGVSGGSVCVCWSDDEGKTWSRPAEPFESVTVDGAPGVFRGCQLTPLQGRDVLAVVSWVDQADPDLPLFNPKTEGILDMKIFLARSQNQGATWSKPALVDTSPFNQPTPMTGPILKLANGELALQFELNKRFYETHTWRHSSVLMFSQDGGVTWPEHVVVTSDPENRYFWWDQRPGVLPDGRVLDLFWTYDNKKAAYLNIHASESRDHGRTWSDLWDVGVQDQPAAPVALPDGRIVMVYVDRVGVPAVKLRTSSDGARTFAADTELVLYEAQTPSQTENKGAMQDAWAEMRKFSVGLPATVQTDNGDVVVVYYAGPKTDETSIEWVRITV